MLSSNEKADVLIVGAGIIGAACAYELASRGLKVSIIDAGLRGATAAGMGHLLILDDNEAELALSQDSLTQWRKWGEQLPAGAAYQSNGTLWLAETEEELAFAKVKGERLLSAGIETQLLSASETLRIEPMLTKQIHGALRIPGDGIVYAPVVADWLLAQQKQSIQLHQAKITHIDEHGVRDSEGRRYLAPIVILANGLQAPELLPEIPLLGKKGHVAITDRYDHSIKHTLVELGYISSAHQAQGSSVVCNIQPRPTGQLFIGATRQFDNQDYTVESEILGQLMRRALHFVPDLASMNIIRSWTGFRAATPDGQPLIGRHPTLSNVWLALGHEGLGITAAPGTARLLVSQILNESLPFASAAFDPCRYLSFTQPEKEQGALA
ncbi:NAD(P)/FAD-dependent oxidoreductase [Vibrio ziniensis]|uniref:FAD-dependent oxidoreductase n=1 Tax=Vibrio ziniensis TaxID=2711221 RepID=A0A6G7CJ60_9VIBR|nr:FAD-dependent oxidoreductase [Vibrio ziniensis]QIH42086.1 FAD-dependent oxidoreductase [Vibrio ziniensis]